MKCILQFLPRNPLFQDIILNCQAKQQRRLKRSVHLEEEEEEAVEEEEEGEEHQRERRSVHLHLDPHAVEGEVGQVLDQVAL